MAATPPFPSHEVSALMFAVLGELADEPRTPMELGKILNDEMGRKTRAGGKPHKSSLYISLKKMANRGLVGCRVIDGENRYFLTRLGFERWIECFDFFDAGIKRYRRLRSKKSADFAKKATLKRTSDSHNISAIHRPPTPAETRAISDHSSPSFRRILQVSIEANVRANDLAAARIEDFDQDRGILHLPENSISGRTIDESERNIQFEPAILPIINEAIDGRRSGLIFVTPTGKPWNVNNISRTFRIIRDRAGVSKDVVLSGRGGEVAKQIEQKRN